MHIKKTVICKKKIYGWLVLKGSEQSSRALMVWRATTDQHYCLDCRWRAVNCLSRLTAGAVSAMETCRTGAASCMFRLLVFQMVHQSQGVTQSLLEVWAKDRWPLTSVGRIQRLEPHLVSIASHVLLVVREVIFNLKTSTFYILFQRKKMWLMEFFFSMGCLMTWPHLHPSLLFHKVSGSCW